MESYLSEEQSEITFTVDDNRPDDHVDRALRALRELQRENVNTREEMARIKANPKAFVKPMRDQFSERINQLREQNEALRRMVERSKIPAYCEMTKKKIVGSEYEDNLESMRGSIRPRNHPDDESNYDKNDARSTCLNYNQADPPAQPTLALTHHDQQQRDRLTNEIRTMLEKAEVFEEELERIARREREELRGRRDAGTERELGRIYEYKKRLIRLLSKLKSRECAMRELVGTYRQMHEETFQRLRDANTTLDRLREARISEAVDEKYAEVVELEERLQSIEAQLEEMDEGRWLEEIVRELSGAVRRMGLEVPRCEGPRELIDELCGMLIECHIASRKDGQAKLSLLKQYHEEEKKNNSKYIMALKAKEQALARRLIDLQMDK